ncbi:hypothetical protein B0H19DRAFT_1055278 [Mycena capillaripes]|nr:hypothetical protein B0H19DRAFT_1055278 [Mycena capillaripes]
MSSKDAAVVENEAMSRKRCQAKNKKRGDRQPPSVRKWAQPHVNFIKAAQIWFQDLQRMTSTAPTRPARNCQVSSRIANDDNSVGLSAAGQNLLSDLCCSRHADNSYYLAKPIIDLVKKIAKLTLFLPETVPLATGEDDIPRRIFELEGEDSIFNCRVDILFREHVREDEREKESISIPHDIRR